MALRQTQGTIRRQSPNWQPWLVFLLHSLPEEIVRLAKKIEHVPREGRNQGRGFGDVMDDQMAEYGFAEV